jgi:hypothetical protein
MTTDASLAESGTAIWSPILALPQFDELRDR